MVARACFSRTQQIVITRSPALNMRSPIHGFPSVKKLIDLKVSAFRNTVIQDAYQMGEQAMGLLRQAVDGKLAPGTKREQILAVSMYI